MLDQEFLIKLLISFLVSGSFAVIAFLLSEKFNTKIAAIIISLPSTAAFSLIFIAWTQGLDALASAATISPAAQGITFIFVIAFVLLINRVKLFSIFVALILWAILALAFSTVEFTIYSSFLFALILIPFSYLTLSEIKPIKTKIKSDPKSMLIRFIFVGLTVSFVIIISKLFGPVWGGIFTAFPALFTSTFYLAYKNYGEDFTKSLAANTLFGQLGFAAYPVSVFFFYPIFGIIVGTIIAYLITIIINLLFFKLVKND